jgi:hypothetical protein
MSLRIQIAVADFGGVEEFEFAHGAIIPSAVLNYTFSEVKTQSRTAGMI